MTPEAAAEGRRLLETDKTDPALSAEFDLKKWLWANREELVRCAEERALETHCICHGCVSHLSTCPYYDGGGSER